MNMMKLINFSIRLSLLLIESMMNAAGAALIVDSCWYFLNGLDGKKFLMTPFHAIDVGSVALNER